MQQEQFSIRMRASKGGAHEVGGKHVSGGEHLVRCNELETTATLLVQKALQHSRGQADFIQIVMEKVEDEQIEYINALPVSSINVSSVEEGREQAKVELAKFGVSEKAIECAIHAIDSLPNHRGAIIMDAKTGEKLGNRGLKGVRVSRLDWEGGSNRFSLAERRKKEAQAIAAKVAHSPYTLAELCWSDDPDYLTGYVSSKKSGYQRISTLKELGDERGGRVFFVETPIDLTDYVSFLEKKPILIRDERYGK